MRGLPVIFGVLGIGALALICHSRNSAASGAAYHLHGDHICVCPSCGYEMVVGAGQRCNMRICPRCGGFMLQKTMGERRLYWHTKQIF